MIEYMLTVSARVCIMFMELALGYLLYRRKMIDDHFSEQLSSFLLRITTPAAIIASYQRDFDPQLAALLGISFVLAVCCYIFPVVISPLVFPSKKYASGRVYAMSMVYTNCGAIGIPLLDSLLGSKGVFLGSTFIVVTAILQWTHGILMLTGDRKNVSLKKLIWNPGTIPAYVGILIFCSPVKLPGLVFQTVEAMGSMNSPLAMIVLGVFIAQTDLKSCFTSLLVHRVVVMRLAVIPLVTLGLLTLIPVDPAAKMALLIGAASPCSMGIPMFAQMFHADYLFPSKCVVNSTLLSILSLPVVLSLANTLWT